MAWPIEVLPRAIVRTAVMVVAANMGTTLAATTPGGDSKVGARATPAGGNDMTTTIKYCTRAKYVNFNPFRSDVSPDEINYLQTFTRPIMGKGGIVEKFHFAPSGLEMMGMVAKDAILARSGRVVSPLIVGSAIQKLIDLRIPTRGFRVAKVEATDNSTFKLTFENKDHLANITGVLRELLERQGAGAKTTLWVSDPDSPEDFVARYPVRANGGQLSFDVDGQAVSISAEGACQDADIYDFPASEGNSSLKGFTPSIRQSDSIGLMFLNTVKLDLEERKAVGAAVRSAVKTVSPQLVATTESSMLILPGELGHTGKYGDWPPAPLKSSAKSKTISVVLDRRIPLFTLIQSELEKVLPEKGYQPSFRFWEEGGKPSDADVVIANFPITMGRQKWIEGAFRNLGLLPLLGGAPKTVAALDKARETAAATIPTSAALVSEVEKAVWEDASVGSLYRRKAAVLNRDSSPVALNFGDNGQVYLSRRK